MSNIETGVMIDASGQSVPIKYVKPYDRMCDRVARRVVARHLKARKELVKVLEEITNDVGLIEQEASKGRSGVRSLGVKGNFQFGSFDGLMLVSRSARYDLRFDERLTVAQGIIEEIIREMTEKIGVDNDIAEFLRQAFKTTSNGLLSKARVMGLFRLKITHPRWNEAMDLIRESIEARRGKNLYRVQVKANRDSDWQSIELDLSACQDAPQSTTETAHSKTRTAEDRQSAGLRG